MQNYISNDIDMDCMSSITTTEKTRIEEENMDLRRGPWTVDEDLVLINYISMHGEGRWNSLARSSGLKRTGKSCRLRWLNYLRPDVKRGDITPEEQLIILELHSRWGNRWSKIAQHLPGRTDNEIKNYWRTRVQKHAKQLKCDVNSQKFKDAMRYLWMPRLLERVKASNNNNNNNNLCNKMDSSIMQNTLRTSTGCPSTGPVEPSGAGPSFESSSDMVTAAGGLEGGDGHWGGEFGEYWCDSMAAGGSGDFGSDVGVFDFDWGLDGNGLTGAVPGSLLGSKGLGILNVSRNALEGGIPDVFGDKTYFMLLDLSYNKLRGDVPKSLSNARYVGHLDLSHNHLCGAIPSGGLFDRLGASSFENNDCLCGAPLSSCRL